MEKIKTLDMVRRIRDAEYEKTKKMSNEELKEYYHNEAKIANVEKNRKRSGEEFSP